MSFTFLVGKDSKEGRENWVADSEVTKCQGCQKEFSLLLRRHHCRECGKIFCFDCSDFESNVHRSHYEDGVEKKKKVCAWCFKDLAIRRRSASNPAPTAAQKAAMERARPPDVQHFASQPDKTKEPNGVAKTSPQEAGGRTAPPSQSPQQPTMSLLFAPFSRGEGGKYGAADKDTRRSRSTTGPRGAGGPNAGPAPLRLSSRQQQQQQQQQQQASWANLQQNHAQVALAIMAVPEAMKNAASWEEKSSAVFRDLHTGLRRLSKDELRDLPHRDEVLAFLDKFGEKRRTHRNQVLEVKSLLVAR